MPWSLRGQDRSVQKAFRMSYFQGCRPCTVNKRTTCTTFNKMLHQEIERLETSCGSLFSFVELASAHMHAVRHVQQDSGDAGGADAAAPSSCSHDAPPPAVRRTKRKSYTLAESLARTAKERARSAFNQHLQANSLHDMD